MDKGMETKEWEEENEMKRVEAVWLWPTALSENIVAIDLKTHSFFCPHSSVNLLRSGW
jgi:hypothetical protein